MLSDDIRLERIEGEYQTVRRAQDKVFDNLNGLGELYERLGEEVLANRHAIEANRVAIEANRVAIEANRVAIEANRNEILLLRQAVAENSQMLAAIIAHLDVPYKPTGFTPAGVKANCHQFAKLKSTSSPRHRRAGSRP
ncbi:MAG: hypothetical protein OXI34_07850 [Chloroflexota bacterium]|nr:hypothetical protein [Chloroflexota bacterium]MDE2947742.1 hypothetical protein [Chloroflexota bacterium]